MLENITNKITGIFQSLSNKGAITEKDLETTLREVRVALLEADVSLKVSKDLIKNIQEKAIGQKVIENVQRDLNIALVNELSKIFDILKIPTDDVLEAADTKWNFSRYQPGLVGGHCIGVDPYYLTHKAKEVGYYPEMILAGRKINDSMGKFIANEVINLMSNKNIKVQNSNILIMGMTFKENCPDIRNTRVIDIIDELNKNSCNVDVFDPWVGEDDKKTESYLPFIG